MFIDFLMRSRVRARKQLKFILIEIKAEKRLEDKNVLALNISFDFKLCDFLSKRLRKYER